MTYLLIDPLVSSFSVQWELEKPSFEVAPTTLAACGHTDKHTHTRD